LLHRLSHVGHSSYRLTLTCGENDFWKYARTWPASQGCGAGRPHFGLAGPEPCATSSFHVILSVNTLVLDIIKICMDFGPYGAFLSPDVPVMVDQQNSWNSLVIISYLLYLEWNIGMLAVNICIL
jgi:hypothetical protein